MKLTKGFLDDVRSLILSARTTVARGVDLVQVHTNFEIGRRIVEQEQRGKGRAAYGKEVVKALAERLMDEFGRGFSERNLASMRAFYLQYQERRPILQTVSAKLGLRGKSPCEPQILQSTTAKSAILQTASAQSTADEIGQSLSDQFTPSPIIPTKPFTLSWSHYVFLLSVKNPDERSFYEIEAAAQSWTLRELKRQFDASLCANGLIGRDH